MSKELKNSTGKKRRKKARKKARPKQRRQFEMPSFHMPRFSMPHIEFGAGFVKKLLVITALVMLLGVGTAYFIEKYTVDTIIVEGSTHYTTEEINEMVIGDGFFAKNSVFLSLRYRNKEIKDVPFIETMSVRILSPTSVKITIYEKAVAGFVEYMGQFIYFDKDGTAIESSAVRTEGIPQVIGMEFDHVVMYEKLPVSDPDIFKKILDVSQLLAKYEIKVDKIFFDKDYRITLYFDQARVKLGTFDNVDEKIIRLKAILPELKGKKGVLKMENYTPDTNITTFEFDE